MRKYGTRVRKLSKVVLPIVRMITASVMLFCCHHDVILMLLLHTRITKLRAVLLALMNINGSQLLKAKSGQYKGPRCYTCTHCMTAT